jgi:hypothetical protein
MKALKHEQTYKKHQIRKDKPIISEGEVEKLTKY